MIFFFKALLAVGFIALMALLMSLILMAVGNAKRDVEIGDIKLLEIRIGP
jgi:hypothetical protein